MAQGEVPSRRTIQWKPLLRQLDHVLQIPMVARSALVQSRGRASNTRVEVPERVVCLASLRLCEMYPIPVTQRAYPVVVLSISSASSHYTPLVTCHTREGISYIRVLVPVAKDDELNPNLLPTRDGVQQPRSMVISSSSTSTP